MAAAQHVVHGPPGHRRVRPAARAVVAVEGDAPAGRAHPVEQHQQPGTTVPVQDREGDARQVDQVAAGHRILHRGDVAGAEQVACGRLGAEIEEASLAGGVGPDHVQPGQAAFQPGHQAGAEPLSRPALHHRIAVGIVAQRRHILHGEAVRAADPRHVDGHVQRVAAESQGQRGGFALEQLDHAFADGGDAWLRCRQRDTPRLAVRRCGSRAGRGPAPSRCCVPGYDVRL